MWDALAGFDPGFTNEACQGFFLVCGCVRPRVRDTPGLGSALSEVGRQSYSGMENMQAVETKAEKDGARRDVWVSKCQLFVALKHFTADPEVSDPLHFAISKCWWDNGWMSAYVRWLKGWGVDAEFVKFLEASF